jgi:hypothetical protein
MMSTLPYCTTRHSFLYLCTKVAVIINMESLLKFIVKKHEIAIIYETPKKEEAGGSFSDFSSKKLLNMHAAI